MSGKVKHFDVGILNMQTEESFGGALPNNYTVARLIRELPSRSRIGFLFVNRTATGDLASGDDWNRTFGFDGKFGLGEAFTLTGFAARTQTPELTGSDHALIARAQYETSRRNFSLGYAEVGENFNPEVGFLQRDNYRSLDAGWRVHFRPDVEWLRELRPHMSYRTFWDFTGFKESEQLHFDSHIDFESGAFFSPAFNRTVEGLHESFEISDGVVVQPGTYQNWEVAWRWNTNQAATFSYSGHAGLRRLSLRRQDDRRHHDQLPPRVDYHHFVYVVLQRRRSLGGQLHHEPSPVPHQLQFHTAHVPAGIHSVQRRHRRLVVERTSQLAQHGGHGTLRRL